MNEHIVESMSLNKILVAILDDRGSITIPTEKFVNANINDRELVADYDDVNLTFTFSLRNKNE